MIQKHVNLRDVGLSLQRLKVKGCSSCCSSSSSSRSPYLPCGRLLRCGAIDACTFDELRRAKTIVNLRMSEDDPSDVGRFGPDGVEFLHIGADNSLEKYDTSDPGVRAWLQSIARAFDREDLGSPVLLHCRSGRDRTGVAVAALLLLLGVPEQLVIREFLLSSGAEEVHIRKACAGFKKAGGIDAYLSKGPADGGKINLERVRASILGVVPESGRAPSEIDWLRGESQLTCRLARAAGVEEGAAYWQSEAVHVCAELSGLVPPGEAAIALAYQGWALSKLERHDEAREALTVGAALARQGDAKPQVQKMLAKELAALPPEDAELHVVSAVEATEAGLNDPFAHVILLQVDGAHWQATRCPGAFTWLRAGELAASAAPKPENLPALEALGLLRRVDVEALGSRLPDATHWASVVKEIADVLLEGCACLAHCADGFGATSTALACFLVLHGLDEPIRAKPGQPSMTAGEAIEVLRAMRRGALASPEDEGLVHEFAQNAWAQHIENTQRAFSSFSSASSASASQGAASAGQSAPEGKSAPSGARVVRQPGDGNCLFHSLAHSLGSGTASTLRAEICAFMASHTKLEIAGTPLADWIQMVSGKSVEEYARKMAKSAQWGGAPEIAACANLRQVNIHVYERRGKDFKLSVPFEVGSSRTVAVLYVGGVHYDSLVF